MDIVGFLKEAAKYLIKMLASLNIYQIYINNPVYD